MSSSSGTGPISRCSSRSTGPRPALGCEEHLIGYVGLMNGQDRIKRRRSRPCPSSGGGAPTGTRSSSVTATSYRTRSARYSVWPPGSRDVHRVRPRPRASRADHLGLRRLPVAGTKELAQREVHTRQGGRVHGGRPTGRRVRPHRDEANSWRGGRYAERDDAPAFADAIDGLLNDPERRARMGRTAENEPEAASVEPLRRGAHPGVRSERSNARPCGSAADRGSGAARLGTGVRLEVLNKNTAR